MKRLYASTVCLPQTVPVLQRVATYIEHGIRTIELGGGVSVTQDDLVHLSGIQTELLLHNYFPPATPPFYLNLSSPSDQIYRRSVNYIVENIERCAMWGIGLYSFHAGFVFDPVSANADGLIFDASPATPEQVEAATQRFIDGVQAILPYAHKHNVTLAIENNVCREVHKGYLILQTPHEFTDFFNRVNDPLLGVLVDTGHVDVTAQTLGFEPVSFIDELQPYIKAFHISQNHGTRDEALPISADNPILAQVQAMQDVPVIIEAHFDDIKALSDHFHWLCSRLGN